MSRRSYSIVEYYGQQGRYRCGYCKSPDTNFTHGMDARILTVQDYQSLIDRGWRRCGTYCYKSIMDQTCCPMYTIRCEALQFKISKSQKKVLKRMAKFLRNELQKDDTMDTHEGDLRDNIDIGGIPTHSKRGLKREENLSDMKIKFLDDDVNAKLYPSSLNDEKENCNSEMKQSNSESVFAVPNRMDDSHDISESLPSVEMNPPEPPCMKAKLLRKQRKQKKLLAQGKTQEEVEAIFKESKQANRAKSLEELFDEVHSGTGRLEFKLVRASPMSSGYQKTSKQSYEIYKKYQATIHGETVTEKQYTRFLVKSSLQMKLVRTMSNEFIETLKVSANLFKKYQMTIHGESEEESDDKSFFNFLVKSSLQPWTPDNGPPSGYGSYHDQYWLDNELIAVGVIDILPTCISSVYFFYDPAYSHLSLGTFSSLREVYLTRQLNKVANDLKYYYMGFYIHSCPKMRYKARMKPSRLLCPETYCWFDIEPCLQKLDKQKYSRLNDDIDAIDRDGIIDVRRVTRLLPEKRSKIEDYAVKREHISAFNNSFWLLRVTFVETNRLQVAINLIKLLRVSILYQQFAMPYDIYKRQTQHTITQEEEDEIKEYASLVGMKCAQRLLLYRY